jgi:malonyl CoA-acyl carrier protein transacylase
MEALREAGITLCVETGPGKVLSGLMKRISRGWPEPPALANVEDWESLEKTHRVLSLKIADRT